MTQELEVAIAYAYDVFSPYSERFSATVCCCPSCFLEADRERLLKTPLREIDGHLLDQYSWSAHGQDDDGPRSDDLRYLLPRYFELIALNDPKLQNSSPSNLTQLGRTPWRTVWSAAEVAAIDGYFDALMRACLANGNVVDGWSGRSGSGYRCALQLDNILVMLVCAGADVARLLQVWDSAPDPAAALHIADFRFSLQTDERGTRFSDNYLEPDFEEAALAIGAFVCSPKATSRIEAAFFQTTDPGAQRLLSDSLFLG
jgi:hypothetical protein